MPSHGSHLGPGSFDVTPASPGVIGNCIPFGDNDHFGFTGFIYRNVPAFTVKRGSKIAFDLGRENDVAVRRNIYFATANVNPAVAVIDDINVASQGIFAASGWTQVVSDTQGPLNPRGDTVANDYELICTVEGRFTFPGGGLVVGFGASPPGAYTDGGCEQVLVRARSQDPSGMFYARFFFRPDQSLDVLDDLRFGGGGNAVAMGGIVIRRCKSAKSGKSCKSCKSCKSGKFAKSNKSKKG